MTIPRKIRDEAFAKRLDQACDSHGEVPPHKYGRLTWIKDRLRLRFGEEITVETARKWFAGESRPRPEKMKMLAEILSAEEAWLSLGISSEDKKEKTTRAFYATAAENILLGFIQLTPGSAIAPPEEGKPEDFVAIINHKVYYIYASLAFEKEDVLIFNIPAKCKNLSVIGIIPKKNLNVDFIKIPQNFISAFGASKGSHIELSIEKGNNSYKCGKNIIPIIKNFAEEA